MYPILIEWQNFILPAWHTFFVLAAFATFGVMIVLRRKFVPEVNEREIANLFLVGYLAGYVGARLLSVFVLEGWVAPSRLISELFRLGAMTFYGGALGTFAACSLYAWLRRLPYMTLYDLCIPAGLVGLAVGRIGCFLNGDDFGIPVVLEGSTPPWWSVTFPALGDGVARYPVQIISTVVVGSFALGLCLNFAKIRQRFGAGSVGWIGSLTYALYRLVIEEWRGDDRGWVLVPEVSTSQFVSSCIILGLVLILFIRKNLATKTP